MDSNETSLYIGIMSTLGNMGLWPRGILNKIDLELTMQMMMETRNLFRGGYDY